MFEANQISNIHLQRIKLTPWTRPTMKHGIWITKIVIAGLVLLITTETLARQDKAKPANLTPGISAAEVEQGWLSLFDGESLFGWKAESNANWRVVDGEIRVDEGDQGLLRTTTQFDDFEVRLEFKCPAHTNSGLFLRTSPVPKNPGDDCFELNIAHPDDNPFPTGSLVYRKKASLELKPETWNRYRAIANGDSLRVWVNGELTVEYVNPKPLGRGFIGLQFREGTVAFRNVAIKPLGQRPMFNGKNLKGWTTDKKMESDFTVTDALELRIKNGKGQIESNEHFGDFVFTTKCKTNALGLNSGVFFRCIPGDLMNGYESQIQNAMNDGDPTKPADCGTGGIFRRQKARRIAAKDQEWFTKTIVACGPHISVWVNGYQVSDWTDKRKPDANPRKGLRLEKGSIIFQGHDPTTDLLFKGIMAKEMVKRWEKK